MEGPEAEKLRVLVEPPVSGRVQAALDRAPVVIATATGDRVGLRLTRERSADAVVVALTPELCGEALRRLRWLREAG